MGKRFFDVIVSLCLILCFSPLFLVLCVMVWTTDGFPVFFVQQRIGLNRKSFRLYKFRTMRILKGTEKGSFDAGDSSRVTRVGRFLRKSKLDELPQLFNVLKGDMSMVGPRPEVAKWVDVYPEQWAKVLTVRPGITDNASIVFRNEEELLAQSSDPQLTYRDEILPYKLDLYLEYVNKSGLWNDLKILSKTFITVLFK
ncbi:MAG: sugar transferase [Breznakibacter sp.]